MFARKLFIGFQLVKLLFMATACAPVPSLIPAAAKPQPTIAPTSVPVAELEKVTLAYGAPIPFIAMLPFDLAQALDLYKQEGLEVTVQYLTRVDTDNALSRGTVDFGGLGIDQPISWQGSDKEQRMVMEFTRFPGSVLVVRSDMKDKIKTFADLKGQQIAYAGTPGLLPYFVTKAGLKPEDVTFVHSGNVAEIAAALPKASWVSALLSDPYATQVLKSGTAFAVMDLTQEVDSEKFLNGEYPNFGLVARTETIQNRPQTVQKMTNALVKALRYIATHNATEITVVLPESVTGKDKAIFIDALQHSLPTFSKDGIVAESGVKNAIEINKALGTIRSDKAINVSALYTNDFVKNSK